MTTEALTQSKQNPSVEQKIQQLREAYRDAPELARVAVERALPALKAQASEAETRTESAGRSGVRQGRVSELLFIVPFAPGGAQRLRTLLRLLEGNFSAGTKV